MVLALERCRMKKRWHGSETVCRDTMNAQKASPALADRGPEDSSQRSSQAGAWSVCPAYWPYLSLLSMSCAFALGPNLCTWDPRAFAFEVPFAKNVLPWSYLSQDQFLLTITIPGQISLSPTDPDHPNWGIPPCPVQQLSIISLSFHFFLPLIMISHHLHYLSVDLAMVCFSPLPVRAGILSVLTHHCIPTSWHSPWHMVGAPYTFAKCFFKGTRD